MSTKIYTGFVIQVRSIEKVLEIVKGFRPWAERQAQKVLQSYLTYGDPSGWSKWCNERRETVDKGLRNPAVDTQFQITVFPDNGRFLGIAFLEHQKWFEKWLKQPHVKEYHYQNQTDEPDNISPRAWKKRERDWDRVLGGDGTGTAAMWGFTIDILPSHGPFPTELKKLHGGHR